MIIGASPEADGQILRLSQALYRKNGLKRVYYSSYVPVVQDKLLPTVGAGQLREHRLYQADWLLRFYGFSVEEIINEGENLAMEYDPKCAWALKNMHLFPIEINRAPLEMLLRVPGIGAKNAYKILGGRLKETHEYALPEEYGDRILAVVEKVKNTPPKYPRGQGKERKNPL